MDSQSLNIDSVTSISPSELLERVHLRLAMAESDQQLQRFTDNHLIEIISVAGKDMQYIDKVCEVREILSHYNRRVKTNEAIGFPALRLLEVVQNQGPVASSLALVYLRFAAARLSSVSQIELLPSYFTVIAEKVADKNQIYELFGLCMPGFMALSTKEKHLWPVIKLSSAVEALLVRFFHCILAFTACSLYVYYGLFLSTYIIYGLSLL
uniref:Cyclin N-terminal domain-containing protein n=1 Tax=Heterorhabditis bacteriophora TaxID=37862 RepID=A0A1I7XTZ2_HETBA